MVFPYHAQLLLGCYLVRLYALENLLGLRLCTLVQVHLCLEWTRVLAQGSLNHVLHLGILRNPWLTHHLSLNGTSHGCS
jgi:hypothetical protein